MPTASGSRTRIVYGTETTQGTAFAGTTKVLRTTTRRINVQRNVMQSAEVRGGDRNIKEARLGFKRVDAAFGFELSVGAYDDFFEYLMANTWATVGTQGAPNLGATSPSTFTRAAGSWVTDGIRPGDLITTGGFSNGANNGSFRVLTVGATTITVDSAAIITETSGAAKTLVVTGKRIEPGVVSPHKTATIERQFLDLAQYQLFTGMSVLSMPLSIQPEKIVAGTWNMIGMDGGQMSGTPISATPTAAPTNSPFSSFEGKLYEGGATLAIVTGLDLMVENKRMLSPIVGSKTSPEVYEGEIGCTGTLTALFQSSSLLNKFINENSSSLWVKLDDINGTDFHNIVIPALKYTGGDIDPPSDGPVPITLPFMGLLDPTSNTAFSWQRSN